MARRPGSSGADTARAIRAAALRLFAERGFDGVSMRDIAAAVGVRVGALYAHVPDKRGLLAELVTAHLESLLAAWSVEPGAPQDPPGRLARFLAFHLRQQSRAPEAAIISATQQRHLDPAAQQQVIRLVRLYDAVLHDILADGAADGSLAPGDPRITARALFALLAAAPPGAEDAFADMAMRAAGSRVTGGRAAWA